MNLDLGKIAAAKLWLISAPPEPKTEESPRDLPYLASALYALITVASSDVARVTCDEWWRVYVNPQWLARAGIREIGEELAHVTWHLLADHADRARDQDVDRSTASAWKTAADITVSHTLQPDRLRPEDLPTAADLRLRSGLSAEQYFALISRLPAGGPSSDDSGDAPEGCGSGADGLARSHEHGPDADLGAVGSLDAREIRRRVAIEYREHATGRGHEPGDALRWVEETLDPRIPWQSILTGAVRRAVGWAVGRGDFTYSRPSRRASSTPRIVLPGQHRPVPRLAIVVDTSASVDDELLARALAEVDGAIAGLGVPGSSVTAYSVDAAVHTISQVRRASDITLVGAGGTDLRPGLRVAEAERPRPDVIIVFTDGDTPWPATPPAGAAVIAVLLGRSREHLPKSPDWAIRVECVQ
ncbi:MAG: VWA-like domain-containing protein [Actinomycetota bacterium]